MGMALGVSMTMAAAAPAAHPVPRGVECGFLDDGAGAGSANSLLPGEIPSGGEDFFQENNGAWQMCLDSSGRLTLFAHQEQWCEANNNNVPELRGCDNHADQQWSLVAFNGGVRVKNGDRVLCGGGTPGVQDSITTESGCSNYHQTWAFETTP